MEGKEVEEAYLFGKLYPVRRVSIEGYGDNLAVSTEGLQKAMFNKKGSYKNLGCMLLDEKIFFFVDDKDISLPYEELVKKIKESL